MVAIGALLGLLLGLYRLKKTNIPSTFLIDMLFYSTIIGFIGARITFILVNFKDFVLHPATYVFSRQGFVFLGGIITGGTVAVWYCRKKKYSVMQIADVMAPSVPLAHMFGRIGCFSAGCCFGRVAEGVWRSISMTFPAVYDKKDQLIGSFVYIDHLQRGLVPPGAARSLPVVPTQLMEAAGNFLIFVTLLLLSRKKMAPGRLFFIYIIIYSMLRFLIEFLRGDVDRGILFGLLSTSQIMSILLAIGVIIYMLKSKPGKENAS
jgi:phosphatidylglycerol:prolipoprotein diacylglycerol transferase